MAVIQCSQCQSRFRFSEQTTSRRAPCPKCGQELTLQVAAERTVEAARSAPPVPPPMLRPVAPPVAPSVIQQAILRSKPELAEGKAVRRLGRFEIRALLGSGSFGEVYRAYDPVLRREVALKVPFPHIMQNEEARARFMREPQAAAQLRHPHIVPVYDTGIEDGQYYIASAFIEGNTLQDLLKKEKLDYAASVQLVRSLAEALHYAHEQGIIHRDVKPANIMVDAKGTPYLMDFGIARWTAGEQELTQDGSVLGTPAYMSPEQAGAPVGAVGPASDQYSLGVVLYELLCGQRPFGSDQAVAMLLYQIREQEPPAPGQVNPKVSKDLNMICLKTLRKLPADRYDTCQALADDLQRVLHGEPIQARRLGPVERFVRWGRRNPLVATLTATVMLGSVFALLLVTWQWRNARANAIEADRQKGIAQQNLTEAEEQRRMATAESIRATEEQRRADTKADEAQANLKLANAKRIEADANLQLADARSKELETQLYANRVMLAHRLALDGHIGSSSRMLDTCSAAMHNWEWNYCRRLTQDYLRYFDKGFTILSIAVSPDGKWIAYGGWDNNVSLCDAVTGKTFQTFLGHTNHVLNIAVSKQGHRIASTGYDSLCIWDVSSKSLICRREDLGNARTLAFSPDGKWLAVGDHGDSSISICNATSGETTVSLSGHTGHIKAVVFSPNSQRLASASTDATWRLWNPRNGKQIDSTSCDASPTSLAFSRDGSRVLVGTEKGYIDIFDIPSKKAHRRTTGHAGSVSSIDVDTAGNRFVSGGSDNSIKVFDLETGDELVRLRGDGYPQRVQFTPDGRHVVSCNATAIKIWDANVNPERMVVAHNGRVTSLAFSPDGISVLLGDGNGQAWRVQSRPNQPVEPVRFLNKPGCVVWSIAPDGKRGILENTSSHRTELWSDDGPEQRLLNHPNKTPVDCVTVDWERQRYLVGYRDGTVTAWRGSHTDPSWSVVPFPNQDKTTNNRWWAGISFTPEGERIGAALHYGPDESLQKGARVWNAKIKVLAAATGQELVTINSKEQAPCEASSFSPDGRNLAWTRQFHVDIVDSTRGSRVLQLIEHGDDVTSLAFSPDGKRIATGSRDRTIKIWDAANGGELLSLVGHKDTVTHVLFSRNGERIASAGGDGTIIIWDSASRVEVKNYSQ